MVNNNKPPKELTLKIIQEGFKEVFKTMGSLEEEKDKWLGLQAMNLKYNHTEDYKRLNYEDKLLIDNVIEKGAYLTRRANLKLKPFYQSQKY